MLNQIKEHINSEARTILKNIVVKLDEMKRKDLKERYEFLIEQAYKGYEAGLIVIAMGMDYDGKPKRPFWKGSTEEQEWSFEKFLEALYEHLKKGDYAYTLGLRTGWQLNGLFLNCIDFDVDEASNGKHPALEFIDYIKSFEEDENLKDIALGLLKQTEKTISGRYHFFFLSRELISNDKLKWSKPEWIKRKKEKQERGEIEVYANKQVIATYKNILTEDETKITIIDALCQAKNFEYLILSKEIAKNIFEYLGYSEDDENRVDIEDIEINISDKDIAKVIDKVKELYKANKLNGWEVEAGLSWYLLKCNLDTEKIHDAFRKVYEDSYSYKRTQWIINITKKKLDSLGPIKNFIEVLKKNGISLFRRPRLYPNPLPAKEDILVDNIILFTEDFSTKILYQFEENLPETAEIMLMQIPLSKLEELDEYFEGKNITLIVKKPAEAKHGGNEEEYEMLLKKAEKEREKISEYTKLVYDKQLASKITIKYADKNSFQEFTLDEIAKLESEEYRVLTGISHYDFVKKYNPHENLFIVEDLLVRKAITLLDGLGASGKSYLALQLGFSVATGRAFLGEYEVFERGNVLYFPAEDPTSEISRRMLQVQTALGIPDAPSEFAVKTLALLDEETQKHFKRFVLLEKTDNKANPVLSEFARKIESECKRYKPKLIILDSLVNFYGLDENSSTDAMLFMDVLKSIATRYDLSILVLHHQRKDAMSGNSTLFRGSGVFREQARVRAFLASISLFSQYEEILEDIIGEERIHKYKIFSIEKANYTEKSSYGVDIGNGNVGHVIKFQRYDFAKLSKLYQVADDEEEKKRLEISLDLNARYNIDGLCFEMDPSIEVELKDYMRKKKEAKKQKRAEELNRLNTSLSQNNQSKDNKNGKKDDKEFCQTDNDKNGQGDENIFDKVKKFKPAT